MFNQCLHKKKETNNNWNTPKEAFKNLPIPKGIIFEPFTNSTSKSHDFLRELGHEVVLGDWLRPPPYDCLVTNPPFSLIQKLLPELINRDKLFILLVPLGILVRKYFHPYFDKINILIPKKRIHFENEDNKKRCPFDTIWITNIKMNKITYID